MSDQNVVEKTEFERKYEKQELYRSCTIEHDLEPEVREVFGEVNLA